MCSAVVLAAQGINPAIINPKNVTFQITDTKWYVPVVALSKENDKKLLELLKSGFKRTVRIKDFNVLNDGKSFFDLPVKNEEEAQEKIIEISRNNDYTTGNLLAFAYFKEYYRLIAIDLSKQTKLKDPQQISFIGKIENQAHGGSMFFIIEKSEESTFEFLQNSVNIL